ncbi:hypothetical protein ACFLZ8_05795 [Planctomycetota bacterium]
MKKPLKTSPDGRICRFPGCRCILSIYNHETLCRVHRDKSLIEQKPEILANIQASTE